MNQPNVRDHLFETVRHSSCGTAADRIPLVLLRDTAVYGQPPEPNRHLDFMSLYLVKQGKGTHVIDGVSYAIARGDVYAMGVGMMHYFADCDQLETDTLHFSPEIFDAETREALLETPGFLSLFIENTGQDTPRHWLHLSPDTYAPISGDIEELRSEWKSGTAAGTVLARSLFVRLAVHLSRLSFGNEVEVKRKTITGGLHHATVAAAVRYLDSHFKEKVRIERVASGVFLSADRFTEVFGSIMGRTPRDYLRYLRLEHARNLLLTTDLSITEIAFDSGFGESAYFTRVFRAAQGVTPSEFRNRRGEAQAG